MTLPRALARAWLATVASAGLSHAATATGPRCTEGTWTIDGGPATVGPLAIHAIQIEDGTPFVTPRCRAQRWELRRPGELRVLFVCRNPDERASPRRFPLRLRARLTEACTHLDGAFAIRRRAGWIRFSATKTGAVCTFDDECAAEAFCVKEPGACEGQGHCLAPPLGCPDDVDPVCGCDGTTYFNACEAAAAGTSIARRGECGESCGGIAGVACPDGQFCELPADQCSSADLEGHCVATSSACPEYYSPVCGCDGVTYANDCFRQAAGAQKAHDGACECLPVCCPPGSTGLDADHDGCADTCSGILVPCVFIDGRLICPGACQTTCDCYAMLGAAFCDDCPLLCPSCGDFWQCKDGLCVEQCGVFPPDVYTCTQNTCGGIAGLTCPSGQVCQLPDFGGCGADVAGQCVPITYCTQQYDPVCGCDGKTYGNDCERRNAGVQRAHYGTC